jgi:hypothetical protein
LFSLGYFDGNRESGEFWSPDLVDSKTRPKQLAKQAGRTVLSMPDEQASNAAQIKQAPVKAVTRSGEEIALQKSPPPLIKVVQYHVEGGLHYSHFNNSVSFGPSSGRANI